MNCRKDTVLDGPDTVAGSYLPKSTFAEQLAHHQETVRAFFERDRAIPLDADNIVEHYHAFEQEMMDYQREVGAFVLDRKGQHLRMPFRLTLPTVLLAWKLRLTFWK